MTNEIIANLSNPDMLAEIAWALKDWREAAIWLHEEGVPDTNEHGNRASMRERFEWYVKYGPHWEEEKPNDDTG